MVNSIRGGLSLVLLLTGIGYIEWMLVPDPPVPKPTRVSAEPWHLPDIAKNQAGQEVEILSKANLWGKLQDAEAAKALAAPVWKIRGIVTSGADRFVLIKIEGQPDKSLRVNEELPGGSQILSIEDDKIWIRSDGKKRSLGVYKVGPQGL